MFFGRRVSLHFDFVLALLVLPLVIVGLSLLSEISIALFWRQVSYLLLGLLIFFAVLVTPIRYLYNWSLFFYIVCVLLILSVEFIGVSKLGARRWISIGGFSLQPSEPAKIAIVIFLAHYINRNPPPLGGYGWIEFIKISLLILTPALLILIEPDLGSALIVLFMGYGMLFVIGVNKKIWLSCIIAFVLFTPIAYKFMLKPYQINRIVNLISGEPSSQVKQSLIAIGSGGFVGKTKDTSTQSRLNFLPIASSDFIFASFVERYGFLGALILIGIYMAIVLHLLLNCYGNFDDYYLSVISSSIAILFFVYMGVNISMTIELAPVVGVPLPLFSYGGSSLITFIILIATYQNALIHRYNDYVANPLQNDILRKLKIKR